MPQSRPSTLVVTADALLMDAVPKFGQAHFRQRNELVISCKGFAEQLVLKVDSRLVLGRRAEEDQITVPDVDLNIFEAYARGVSKHHAAIEFSERVLTLRDLGSRNGTFLNMQQLAPNAYRILRDNDQINLGNLELHVHFQVPANV